MADLTTLAGIEAELADTADYDVTLDVSKAKRWVAALRRKLDFPRSHGRGQVSVIHPTLTRRANKGSSSSPVVVGIASGSRSSVRNPCLRVGLVLRRALAGASG